SAMVRVDQAVEASDEALTFSSLEYQTIHASHHDSHGELVDKRSVDVCSKANHYECSSESLPGNIGNKNRQSVSDRIYEVEVVATDFADRHRGAEHVEPGHLWK